MTQQRPGTFIRVMVAMQWLGGRPSCRDYLSMLAAQRKAKKR